VPLQANLNLKDDIGKRLLNGRPLVYCTEWVDNNGKASNIVLPANAHLTSESRNDLLNGIYILKTMVPVVEISRRGTV